MAQEGKEMIQALTRRFTVYITYMPVRDEVNPQALCTFSEAIEIYEIQPQALLDPIKEVTQAAATAKGRPTAIFIPGRRFDATGTRHGKGAGWYDRFLAQAPSAWVRIGFCWNDQFSREPLVRQPWDEPIDYLVVVRRSGGDPQIYETQARA